MELNQIENSSINKKKKPFCPGCSYHVSTNVMGKAFDDLGLNPLDVILVSDIGCCGILDPLFNCHTVHGLHGRAAALASGIALANENPNKKIVAVQGDGGATIGLHHLLVAARRSLNFTLIVKNNMVYGMTGGQESGLTASNYTPKNGKSSTTGKPFDLCELAKSAGANYIRKVKINNKELKNYLMEAINFDGFALIELMGTCPSYGMVKVSELDDAGVEEFFYQGERRSFELIKKETKSLISYSAPEKIFESNINKRTNILIAGGAGQSIQSAAEFLGSVAITCGLEVSKRGDYPITVGTGFSNAEVILSNKPINYNGVVEADFLIATSNDGLKLVEKNITDKTIIVADSEVELKDNLVYTKKEFFKEAGKKGAVISAIVYILVKNNMLPIEAFYQTAKGSRFEADLIKSIDLAKKYITE